MGGTLAVVVVLLLVEVWALCTDTAGPLVDASMRPAATRSESSPESGTARSAGTNSDAAGSNKTDNIYKKKSEDYLCSI